MYPKGASFNMCLFINSRTGCQFSPGVVWGICPCFMVIDKRLTLAVGDHWHTYAGWYGVGANFK